MKYCGNCGYQMDDSDVYCGNCGSKSETDYSESGTRSELQKAMSNYDSRNDSQAIGLNEPKKNSTGKLVLKIMAWIFLFPVMLVYTFFTAKIINKWLKRAVAMIFGWSFLVNEGIINSESSISTFLFFAI